MSENERADWLDEAFTEVGHIPAEPFLSACQTARRTCDHPAKIVPAIIRASDEWASDLLKVEWTKRRQYENAGLPKLEQHEPIDRGPEPTPAETAEILAGLRMKAKSERGAWGMTQPTGEN